MPKKDQSNKPQSSVAQISMSTQNVVVDRIGVNGIGLSDLEAIRLILSGNSIVDWERANFRTMAEVDQYLKVLHFDWNNRTDRRRIERVFQDAVQFLETHLDMPCVQEVKDIEDIRNLFLWASDYDVVSPRQTASCVVLKLMHVLQHLDSAELRHQAPIAEEKLLAHAEQQILSYKDAMKSAVPGVVEFYGSRKTRDSIVSKLLAKKEDVASTVFDKLRFRIITKTKDDLLPLMVWLQRQAFPYNFVIPGQSHNNLMPFRKMVAAHGLDRPQSNGIMEDDVVESPNEFSSTTYRVINFIVDVPVRIDDVIAHSVDEGLGKVVFVMAEFQIVDQATAVTNEEGDNSHLCYKERQRARVQERLQYGQHIQHLVNVQTSTAGSNLSDSSSDSDQSP